MAINSFKIDKSISLNPQASAPSSPSNGDIYYDSTLNKFRKYENGAWSDIGSGGGGGGNTNFIGMSSTWAVTSTDDRDAELSVGNWASYADAANTYPVDMTGGTANVTITRTTTSGEILNGNASFKFTKDAANRQGQGASVVFNLPPAYQGKSATLKLQYKILSGTVSPGDINWFIYDVTNSSLITPANNSIYNSSGTLITTFTTPSSAPTPANIQLRLGIHISSTTTSAITIIFDDVVVEPGISTFGSVITDLVNESSSFNASGVGTISNVTVFTKRIGDQLFCRGYFVCGSPSGVNASIDLPAKYVIDTTKIHNNTDAGYVGFGVKLNSSATSVVSDNFHPIFFDGSTTSKLFIAQSSQSNVFTKQSGSSIFISGSVFTFEFTVPIRGWSSNISIGSTSSFYISGLLASGSRITGTAPTALGQYRSYLRTANTTTYTEGSAAPSIAPTSANGIFLYTSGSFSVSDSNNQPSRYDIFVGKNKFVTMEWYKNAGRTGLVSVDAMPAGATSYGVLYTYDPTTGIVQVNPSIQGVSTTMSCGVDPTNNSNVPSLYFDIKVSDNAQFIGASSPRSEIRLSNGNGYGSTNTKIRRFSTLISSKGQAITYLDSASTGASFTINEDGIYAVTYSDAGSTNSQMGLSVNSNQLSTDLGSISNSSILIIGSVTAGFKNVVSYSGIFYAGDVIRPHTDGSTNDTGVSSRFTIVKIAD